jgi:hypothetical protein
MTFLGWDKFEQDYASKRLCLLNINRERHRTSFFFLKMDSRHFQDLLAS